MPVKIDVEAAVKQAQEQTGITDEAIQAAVEGAARPKPIEPPQDPEKIEGEETLEGDEVEDELEEETPEEEEEEENPEEEEAESEEELEKAPEQRKGKRSFQSRINRLYKEKKELERLVETMSSNQDIMLRALEAVKERRPERTVEPLPELDWDSMTPSEIATQLRNEYKAQLSTMREQIREEEVAPLIEREAFRETKRDIAETATKHKDYWDYRPEMAKLAKQHPTLTAEEVYFLAKKDLTSVQKSVAKRLKAKTDQKKAAKVEKRSSSATRTTPQVRVKSTKDVAAAVAEQLRERGYNI